jgi:hypothetical protein
MMVLIAQLRDRPGFYIERVLLQTLVGWLDQPIRAISGNARANFQLPDGVLVFSTEPLHDTRRSRWFYDAAVGTVGIVRIGGFAKIY